MTLDQQIKRASDNVVKAQINLEESELIAFESEMELNEKLSNYMILLFKKAEQQQRQFQPVERVS